MKKPAAQGRPPKLTKELQDQIVGYIAGGNYVETAAAAAGIVKSTLYDWLKRGAAEKSGIYKDFSNAVNKAVAGSEISEVQKMERHSQDTWQAVAWRLERRFPDKWGRKEKIQADINSQHTEKEEIVFEQKLTADPEARELLRQLFRRQQEMERTGEK